jgi:serine phosphatase RsbU (regulator of sigma subunit)
MLYNAAYVQLIGDKHPAGLGRPAREVLSEAWELIGPMMQGVKDTRTPTWMEDSPVPLLRHGFLEECYFTFSFSGMFDAEGSVPGILAIASETTEAVLLRRRAQLLLQLRDALGDVTELEEVPQLALPLLRAAERDIVAVDVHLDTVPPESRRPLDTVSEKLEEIAGRRIAHLPLAHGSTDRSRLVVELSPQLAPDEDYLGFLRLVAAALGQALDRVRTTTAERRTTRAQRAMSEAFQRSLLPEPTRTGRPEVAVRYQPATEQAQVGGDWYDLVELADGSLAVVVGDVAGHDQESAVGMAQVRNLLRGIAYTRHPEPPSQVLLELDRAMGGMAADLMATAVLAHVSGSEEHLVLRWSNAGHPPPVLIGPDGSARLLETEPDLLLGLDGDATRVDHVLDLPTGSTVVFYTDGLVERRDAPLTDGLAWLVEAVRGRQDLGVGALCDHLLEQVSAVEDDVALLVLRA